MEDENRRFTGKGRKRRRRPFVWIKGALHTEDEGRSVEEEAAETSKNAEDMPESWLQEVVVSLSFFSRRTGRCDVIRPSG